MHLSMPRLVVPLLIAPLSASTNLGPTYLFRQELHVQLTVLSYADSQIIHICVT